MLRSLVEFYNHISKNEIQLEKSDWSVLENLTIKLESINMYTFSSVKTNFESEVVINGEQQRKRVE